MIYKPFLFKDIKKMSCENLVKGREKTKKHIPDFSKPLKTLSDNL